MSSFYHQTGEIHGNMASHNGSPTGASEQLRRDGMIKDESKSFHC